MFNFLFRRKNGTIEAKKETQRDTVARALGELNAIIATLDPKPAVTVTPETGEISLDLPEQMPDEALALPAPEVKSVVEEVADTEANTDDIPRTDAPDESEPAQKPA